MDNLILVNRENSLDKNYVPNDLVICDENENNFHEYLDPNLKPTVRKEVFNHFQELRNNALKEGFDIIIDSGYRSYFHQLQVYGHYLVKDGIEATRKRVALPGCSEHQTGLAFDLGIIESGNIRNITLDEAKWLEDNAFKLGFILRYPKGKEDITGFGYEPWHFRYVGSDLAEYMIENDLTLEEYHSKKKCIHK